MDPKQLFEDFSAKISQVVKDSPIQDMEKNIKAGITATLARMDVITREEFELQQQMIEHLCTQVAHLQEKIEQLENKS